MTSSSSVLRGYARWIYVWQCLSLIGILVTTYPSPCDFDKCSHRGLNSPVDPLCEIGLRMITGGQFLNHTPFLAEFRGDLTCELRPTIRDHVFWHSPPGEELIFQDLADFRGFTILQPFCEVAQYQSTSLPVGNFGLFTSRKGPQEVQACHCSGFIYHR